MLIKTFESPAGLCYFRVHGADNGCAAAQFLTHIKPLATPASDGLGAWDGDIIVFGAGSAFRFDAERDYWAGLDEYHCRGCGRPEDDCSAEPCDAVQEDRAA